MSDKGGIGGLAFEQDDLFEDALDLHAPINQDTSLMEGSDVIYNSVTTINNTGPVEFVIPRDEECSLILDQTRLIGHIEVRRDDVDNTAIASTEKVFLANNFASNLFSQVEIYINGTQVCDLSTANSYPFTNFIQTELSYDTEVKECQLRAEGYFNETAEEMSAIEPNTSALKRRAKMIREGKKVYFCTRIGADIMYTDKYLPPNVDLKIKLIRNDPRFGILHNETDKRYITILKDLKLKMRKVLPSVKIRNDYKLKLTNEPCYIPYKSTQLKLFVIPPGVTSTTITNIASGILPKQVIFGMIHNEAMTGSYSRNPFKFEHFGLNRFNLIKNGQWLFPKPFQPDFESDNYVDLYRHMYDSIGFGISNFTCGVTKEAFKEARCFLTADLNPDRCNGYHLHSDESGKLDIELGFKSGQTHPIYLLSYSIYNSGVKIEDKGQVVKIEDKNGWIR